MELKYLAAVQHHFISPSSNAPIIKPSQDNLLGVYKITSDDIELTQTEATHLLSGTEAFNGILPEPAIIEGKRVRWTGKQIYSVILPPITLKVGKFIVENGEVKQGQVDKKISNMVMQAIHSEYGSSETARYINDLQTIISRFLIKTGFSVGVSDMLLHPDLQKRNQEHIIKAFEDEVELMRKVHLNILDDKGTGNFADIFETESNKITSTANEIIMNQTYDLLNNDNNRVKFMVNSGAKGSKLNIKQMICLLGQQVIEGSRVPLGFTDRTLPHYPRYENGLESRGFVSGNFIEGLNPQEYFFHAIAGRIGLIDTAVKTAKSGYLQRKLVKMMEDLKAYHDCSVRDGNNNIIEFCYGADGFDGMKLERQKTSFAFISKEDLMSNYIITEGDIDTIKEYVLSKSVNKMLKDYADNKWLDICQKYNKGVRKCLDLIHIDLVKLNNSEVIDNVKYPANIPKLIAKAKLIYGLEGCKVKSNMHFIDVINRIEECLDDCSINGVRNNVLMILLYDYLAPKRVLRDYRFNNDALEYVCSQIYLGFQKGIVNAGEMVGPVGAQSIGEQSTQLSVIRTEKIIIGKKNKDNKIELIHDDIGTIIDNIFETKNENDLVGYVNNDSDINNAFIRTKDDYYVLTVNRTTRKTEWQRITEFSRHPCNGGLVEVTTLTGRKITTTKSHSHLINSLDNIESIRGDKLSINNRIPILLNNTIINENKDIIINNFGNFKLNELTGWFFGAYLSEGNINYHEICITSKHKFVEDKLKEFMQYIREDNFRQKIQQGTKTFSKYVSTMNFIKSKPIALFTINNFGKGSLNKKIPNFVLNSNKIFIKHLIRAYFDYDGNVNSSYNRETVRVHSISKQLIKDIAYLLSYFGIATTQGLEKKSDIGNYDLHTLKILRKHIIKYYELIGTDLELNKTKFEKIKENLLNRTRHSNIIDCISNVGKLLSKLAAPLDVEGYSRNFKRYETIDIGRECLINKLNYLKQHKNSYKLDKNLLSKIEYHINNDIIWDKIVNIKYLPDNEDLVYDIGVEGNHTFCLSSGIFTHNTLNTFHTAGTGAKVTAAVPRMEEILSVTSKPKNPSNILYLKADSRFDKDKAEVIKNSISQITIGEILKNDPEFYLEPTNKIENVLDEDRAFMKFYEVFAELEDNTGKDIKNNPWVIRLEFDRKEMINHNVSMADIHIIMSNEYPDAVLMYADDNSGKLVFRIKMPFESKQEVEDDIRLLKGKVEEIKNVIIKGVDNINNAFLNDIEDTKDKNNYIFIDGKKTQGNSKPGDIYTKKKEFVITTEGSNLFELLIRDDIDETRSYSIEPNEMWSIFGIEACKFIIQQQFFKVFIDNGAFTNPRHIGLLVNKMCHDGEPYSINIYGVAKENIGPLAKASFERPVDFFKNAAIFGEIDDLKGVSANIMMGQIPNAGTGSVKCYLDEEALAEGLARKGLTKSSENVQQLKEKELLKQFESRICVSEEDKIKINMTDVKHDGINLDMIPTIEVE